MGRREVVVNEEGPERENTPSPPPPRLHSPRSTPSTTEQHHPAESKLGYDGPNLTSGKTLSIMYA